MLFKIIMLVFAAAFCSTMAVYAVLQSQLSVKNRVLKRRLENLTSDLDGENAPTGGSILRDDKLSKIPLLNRILLKFKFTDDLKRLLIQAGSTLNPGTLVLAILSFGGFFFLLAYQITSNLLPAIIVGVFMALQPLMFLQNKKRRRREAFEALLPDAMDLITNALKSGFSFETAMKMVAQEVPDPLGVEFALTLEEQNIGGNFTDTLFNLRERVPSDDLDLMITALLIHKKTGGNLAEVLEKTAGTIRDRFRLKREIKTKTAHGRFSGLILVLLPLFMIGIIMALNPTYFMVLIHEKVGNYLLGAAVIMQIIGLWVIKKIIDVKI